MKTIEDLKKEKTLPVVISDHDGFITYVNPRFEEVFGWKLKEALGKPLTIIIPKNLHDAHHLGFSRFLATGKATLLNQPLKLKAVTKNGHEFESEHFIIAEKNGRQWVFGATIHPSDEKGGMSHGR